MESQEDVSSSAPLLGGESKYPSEEHHIVAPKSTGWGLNCRHVLAVMSFLGFVNVYALRVNLSVAMVAMVNSSYSNSSSTTSDDDCPGELNSTDHNNKSQDGEFPWDEKLQGIILGSFFYGYIVTQIPGGRLAELFGGKKLYGLGILCTAVFTLVTPLAAKVSPYLLIAVRILEGLGEAVTFPAMHAILARWCPPLEISKMGMFVYAGAQFGTVVSMPLSGVICDYWSWEWVFYLFGGLGVLWFILFWLLVFDDPASHPRITYEERNYIETSIGKENMKRPPIPFLSLLTSVPLLATAVAHFCYNWGFYTLLTTLPSYMKEVLHFDLSSNGILSALPYLVMWIVMNAGGQLADYLRSNGILSTTVVRRTFNSLGLFFPMVTLVTISFIGCDKVLVVVILTIGVGLGGLAQSGYSVNHLDLAPPFAGTLMGITNSFATIPGFVGPQVVGILTNNNPTKKAWQKVFFISAAIYAVGLVVFLIFGSGKEQPWAFSQKGKALLDDEDEDENNHAQVPDDILTFATPRNQQSTQQNLLAPE